MLVSALEPFSGRRAVPVEVGRTSSTSGGRRNSGEGRRVSRGWSRLPLPATTSRPGGGQVRSDEHLGARALRLDRLWRALSFCQRGSVGFECCHSWSSAKRAVPRGRGVSLPTAGFTISLPSYGGPFSSWAARIWLFARGQAPSFVTSAISNCHGIAGNASRSATRSSGLALAIYRRWKNVSKFP